jgi:hypothetical protein
MSISREEYDPVFLHARREAVVLLIAFVLFMVWTVGVSFLLGYRQPEGQPVPVLIGMPRWAFWGVFLPWMVANVFTIVFSVCYVANDPLEADQDASRRGEQVGADV